MFVDVNKLLLFSDSTLMYSKYSAMCHLWCVDFNHSNVLFFFWFPIITLASSHNIIKIQAIIQIPQILFDLIDK